MDAPTPSVARENFAEVVRKAQTDPVVIEKRSPHESVVIVPELSEWFFEAAEELEDISAFDAAIAEEGESILLVCRVA